MLPEIVLPLAVVVLELEVAADRVGAATADAPGSAARAVLHLDVSADRAVTDVVGAGAHRIAAPVMFSAWRLPFDADALDPHAELLLQLDVAFHGHVDEVAPRALRHRQVAVDRRCVELLVRAA